MATARPASSARHVIFQRGIVLRRIRRSGCRTPAQAGAAKIGMEHNAGGIDDRTKRGRFRFKRIRCGLCAERSFRRKLPHLTGKDTGAQLVKCSPHRRRHSGGGCV